MDYKLSANVMRLYITRLWKERWFKAVSALAAVVVFCTVYALILPAITLEGDTICGETEHVHGEECYAEQQIVTCGYDEHVHGEACYEMQPALVCGQEEIVPHSHNNSCYRETQIIVCGMTADDAHEHSAECCLSQLDLACGLTEEEGHVHGDGCYEPVSTLVCSSDEHIHDENCTVTEKQLCCAEEEHRHTESCFAEQAGDPEADVETYSDWSESFAELQMTGDWAEDLLSVAETQIGYRESELNFVITEDGKQKGYTRYGAWDGDPYGDWNARFVSFCMHFAGIEEFPFEPGCGKWIEALNSEQYEYYHVEDDFEPVPGDLVFFDLNADHDADHVGIIKILTEKEEGGLAAKMIEGDVEDCVKYIDRDLDGCEVLGFARIPENPNREIISGTEEEDDAATDDADADREEGEREITLSTTTEDGITVTVSGPASSFPEGPYALELTARNMNEAADDPEAMEVFERLQDNLDSEGVGARTTYLLDISIWQNGEEVEPLGPVTVSISGIEEEISMIYHVEEDEVTEVPACESDEVDVAFETDHFSFYGFVVVAEPRGAKAANSTSFTVQKTWTDFWKAHDPVTIRLMRTDSSGKTTEVSGVTPLILSAQNNWKGTFSNLPLLSAGESYSVVEAPVPAGYAAQYGAVEETQATGGQYWVPVSSNTLVAGHTYALRVQNQNYVLGQSTTASSRMTRTPATPGGSVTVNGVTHANHFAYDDIPVGAQWTVTASGSYFKFQNGRGYYMHEEDLTTSSNRATRMSFTNGILRCIDEDNESLYWGGSYYTLSERNYEPFQLYELVTVPASGSVYSTTIRNKPLPEPHSETLTVRKVWSDSWETHQPVTVHLLSEDETGHMTDVEGVSPLTLSEANGWTNTFTGLSSNEDGSFPYAVFEEPVAGYVASYGHIQETSGTGEDVWLPVTDGELTDGMTYAFYARNGVFSQNDPSYQDIQTASVTMNGSITFDGVTYSNYLSNVPAGAQWTASEFGSYFQLQNGNHRYLGGDGGYFAVTNGAHGYSFSNGKLYDNNSKRYIFWNSTSYRSTTNSGSAQTFQLYVKIDADAGGGGHAVTITNTRVYPQQLPIDPDLDIHKQIDYLGDGAGNPDTSLNGQDDYRLYLDVVGSHQPVDLLIVADVTDSMKNSLNGATDRKTALDAIVNGSVTTGNNSNSNNAANAGRADDGIIYNFLQMHPENKVAVVCFSGGNDYCGGAGGSPNGRPYTEVIGLCCPITQGWTDKYGLTGGNVNDPKSYYCRVTRNNETPGTNYEIALKRAHEMLEQVKDDGHLKVMIFLTDGEPNVNIINGRIYKNETNEAAKQAMRDHTKSEFVTFLNTHPGLVTYIVGISPDANDSTKTAYAVLTGIANEGHVTYFPADSADQLETALQTIINNSKLSLVEINDTLSDYVEYNTEQPDIKVTRRDKDGSETTVWIGNEPTQFNYDDSKVRIINSVQYEPDTKRVRVVFNPACYLDGDNTFTLSFNVTLAEKANTDYFKYGYSNTGDANTDYGTNATSTGKPGFFSNANAFVTFTAYSIGYVEDYPDPVVQSRILKLQVDKVGVTGESTTGIPLAGAEFDLYREAAQTEEGAVTVPSLAGVYGVRINEDSIVTGAAGSSDIQALMPGRYYLVETKPPDGYYIPGKIMAFDIEADDRIPGNGTKEGITISAGDAYADNASAGETDNNDVLHLKVKNKTAHPLPHTGGIGNAPFIMGGLLLSAGTLIYGYMRCRRERRRKV